MQSHRTRSQHGFSLIELMVVITIIGLLGGIVGVNVMGMMRKANIGATKDQMREIVNAINVYRIENRRLPESLDDLVGDEDAPLMSEEVPTDSWGNEFFYEPQGSRTYELISWGADGVEGGENEEEDIDLDAMRRRDSDKE